MLKVEIERKKEREKCILENIHLEFNGCGMVFIIGKSGAGKTTLLNIMAGNDNEFEGSVICGKEDVLSASYRKRVDIVNQDYNLIGSLSVKENILLGAQIAEKKADEEHYRRILVELGLEGLEDRRINLLSGGEKQRTAIARALLRGNGVLFADEPTGNLDTINSGNIYSILKKMSEDHLIIIVSHDLEAAREYGDRIIEIEDGHIKKDDTNSTKEPVPLTNPPETETQKSGWQIPYAVKRMKHRKKQCLRVIIPVVLAMIGAFLALGFFSGIDNRNNEENRAMLELDRFTFYQMFGEKRVLDEEDIEKIQALGDFSYCIPYYYPGGFGLSCSAGELSGSYYVIDSSAFMKNRYKNIRGTFPQDKHEVIIDERMEAILKELGVEECIGQILTVDTDRLKVKITGVKRSFVGEGNSGHLYILKELAEEWYREDLKHGITLAKEDTAEFGETVYAGLSTRTECSDTLLQGREIQDKTEMLVSKAVVNDIFYYLRGENYMREEDIAAGNARETLFGKCRILVDHEKIVIGQYNIVGIVDSDEKKAIIMEYPEQQLINRIDVYAKKYDNAFMDRIREFCENSGFTFEESGGIISTIISSQAVLMTMVLTVFSVIIFVVAVVVTSSFMRISIEQRKYEIGVLKSLGCSKKDVFRLVVIEQSFLTLVICGILGVICLPVGVICSSGIIHYNRISIYRNCLWHFGVIALLVFGCVVGTSIPGICKMARGNIAKSIADRYS